MQILASDVSKNTTYYCPNPGSYAVVRLNPVAMVKNLDDPEALAAAEALETKAYLVYLQYVLELLFPNRPWYRYCVCPIAPSLRAEDKDQGYAPEMCVPIFPNTSHPQERTPVRTKPVFPYSNCYHWAALHVDLRVRARPEEFDERNAVQLPAVEKVELNYRWADDMARMDELQAEYRASLGLDTPARPVIPFLDFPEQDDSADGDMHRAASVYTDSLDTRSSYTSSGASSMQSEDDVDAIINMNIFGGPDQDVALLPLVDLWLDLAENLKQEDIPDPLEFYKERDAMIEIIQSARSRAYAAANAPPAAAPSEIEAARLREGAEDARTRASSRGSPRLPKALRKLGGRFRSLARRFTRPRDRSVPFMPSWP